MELVQVSQTAWQELLAQCPAGLRGLRRSEYERLAEAGAFDGERLELISGALVTMSPQGAPHGAAVDRLTELFVGHLLGKAHVRVQGPYAASDVSEPEPDLAVYPRQDYSRAHPSSPLLVIEVSQSSLAYDQTVKSRMYANAGVPELWIVDLAGRQLEIRHEPREGTYASCSVVAEDGVASPQAFPDLVVRVAELLP